jgi:hypothetical protein
MNTTNNMMANTDDILNKDIIVGAFSFEEPYRVCSEGVQFRGRLAITLGDNLSRKSCCEIAKALNVAYREGFSEGSLLMNK